MEKILYNMLTKKFIDEPNLYRLIIRSKLKSAEKFERWIFEEVLPSIRKYGVYLGNKTIDELLDNPKFLENLINKLEYKTNSYKEVRKGIGEDYILRWWS